MASTPAASAAATPRRWSCRRSLSNRSRATWARQGPRAMRQVSRRAVMSGARARCVRWTTCAPAAAARAHHQCAANQRHVVARRSRAARRPAAWPTPLSATRGPLAGSSAHQRLEAPRHHLERLQVAAIDADQQYAGERGIARPAPRRAQMSASSKASSSTNSPARPPLEQSRQPRSRACAGSSARHRRRTTRASQT